MTAPASDTGICETWVPRSCFSPICTVSSGVDPPVDTSGHRYWFHAPRNENTANAANEGRASGTATLVMKRRCPYPSSWAASCRSRGICKKAWRNRKMPNPVARKGTDRPS